MNIKLMEDSFSQEELRAVQQCFTSGEYTQGKKVREFEEAFAKWNNSKHTVMVNSGSSANLLAIFILKEQFGLNDGDEVLVPAVTWPTTIYPIIQHNLKPVFCDVDESYNISLTSIKKMTTDHTKAIFIVHVLGQPANMGPIMEFCKARNITVLEDCCESLGAAYRGNKVGNLGEMGTFSFYFGHHINTIEGGMITTHSEKLADLLRSARSHGWVRGSPRAKIYEHQFDNLDFVFDMLGYNLRSTNVNAAIGLVQLKKIDQFLSIRKSNHAHFISLLRCAKPQKVNFQETSSFSLGILLNSEDKRKKLLQQLPKEGIECRPIIAGNLLEQPVFKDKLKNMYRADICNMANAIHTRGIYLPNHQKMSSNEIEHMVKTIEKILS